MTKVGVRVLIAASTLAGGICLLQATQRPVRVHAHRPMRDFPMVIREWAGKDDVMAESIVKQLKVDDYLYRTYTRPDGMAVQFYIGYFESQRTAEKLHSPKICIPAAGWEPVRSVRTSIELAGRPAVINEYVIEKDRLRQIVFYWYQARGRTLASEYWTKFWVISDALTRNRTDGALVRAVVPVERGEGESQARVRALEFVSAIDPWLSQFIPN
jgi:EpsI family protein